MPDHIALKCVLDLLDNHFIIPPYQRGYRWTSQEVNDLLNDIWEFTQKDQKSKKEFYCLQPIIVTPCENGYIVIDGQQRLTTIYIIFEVLKEIKNHLTKKMFTLEYQTRADSEEFLKNIELSRQDENIDYYHICNAYTTVQNWFETKQGSPKIDVLSTLLRDDNSGNNVKVIWYEVDSTSTLDQIEIFTRINTGKIPLTNAELVKALLLREDNFQGNERGVRLAQLEMASDWDNIEYSLGDNQLWYFLCDNQKQYENRIEFIFDLIAGTSSIDKYYTFRYFNKQFAEHISSDNIWQQIKKYYLTFSEWFEHREYYHLIGYLVSLGENLKNLEHQSSIKSKSEFKEYLKEKIKNYVRYNIDELNYEEDRRIIKRILLLFNIVTLLSNNNTNARFQFGRYKTEEWDIEHIHSVQSERPEAANHKIDWLKEVYNFTENEDLKNKVKNFLNSSHEQNDDTFVILYDEILKTYSEDGVIEDVDDISNLALLDSGTNRGYKNAVFPIKRQRIIEKDTYGTFIPLCTKNVFMKYYNKKVDQMTFWGKNDRRAYLEAIKQVLSPYIPKNEDRGNDE